VVVADRRRVAVSASGSQAAAFWRDIAKSGEVWTVEDDGGIPAPKASDGRRALPVWSTRSRVERIIKNVPAYAGFRPVSWSLSEFEEEIDALEEAGYLVGINWSGPRATGYDLEPSSVRESIEAAREA
jgi:hypothetical protein